MKLRQAKKLYKKTDLSHYRHKTVDKALSRMSKTKTNKAADKFWFDLMDELGPFGRFDLAMRCHVNELVKQQEGKTM